MLEQTIRRYQNRAIEAAQVIEDLIGIARELRAASARGETLGLSDDELAFYDALGVGYAETMLAKSEIQREALNLPAQERIELVVELWDSLVPGEIPVPDWQRDLIRDRLPALEDVLPEERSVPWEAVRKRVFSDKT